MKRSAICVSVCLIFVSAIMLSSCSSGTKNVGLTVTSPGGNTPAIDEGQSLTIAITATNDSGDGVTWALVPASGNGCLNTTTETITSVTYMSESLCGGTAGHAATHAATRPRAGAAGKFQPAAALYTATLTATSIKQTNVTATITINVNAAPTLSAQTLTASTIGSSYSQQVAASGGSGTLTYAVTAGAPPLGLSMSAAGLVTGTPTSAAVATTFTVQVTDQSAAGAEMASGAVTIPVNLPALPTVTAVSVPATATVGIPYTGTFTATGYAPLTWTATVLPTDGLALSGTTGASNSIMGTPTTKQTLTGIVVTVTDGVGQHVSTAAFTITISNPAPPTITQVSVPTTATVGTAYTGTFSATGSGTLTWSATGLGDGLALSGTTGLTNSITGTPTTHGTLSVVVTVTDTFSQSASTSTITITISNPAPPTITSLTLPGGSVGVAYTFQLTASGYGPFSWAQTGLSDGLTMTTGTGGGSITGTPTTATTVSFSATVTDAVGQSSAATPLSIVVSTEAIAFGAPAPPTTIVAGATASVNAVVTGDAGAGGVDWTFACGGAACGSGGFAPTHTASGGATVFTAPSSVPSGGSVTITATAHDAPSPAVNATITVTAPAAMISFTNAPSSLAVSASSMMSATITNDAAASVNWSVTCGSASCGGFPTSTTANTASGASVTYMAPATVPTGGTVTITATVSNDSSVSSNSTVTITPAATYTCPLAASGGESLLSGNYVFVFNAINQSDGSKVQAVGEFVANGGAGGAGTITAGIVDSNGTGADNTPSVGQTFTGCYTLPVVSPTSTTPGIMVLNPTTGGGSIPVFAIALAPDGNFGQFVASTSSGGSGGGGTATGTFTKQANPGTYTAASMKGPYAVNTAGANSQNYRAVVIGRFDADGVSAFSNGAFDLEIVNIEATGSSVFLSAGFSSTTPSTFTAPDDVFGRGTATFEVSTPIGTLPIALSYYFVTPNAFFVQTTSAPGMETPLLNGEAITQVGCTGAACATSGYSNASLDGNAIIGWQGVDPGNPTATPAVLPAYTDGATGRISSTGNGVVTTILDETTNSTVVYNDTTLSNGSFSVVANGTGTLTIGSGSTTRALSVVMYDTDYGFVIGGVEGAGDPLVARGQFGKQTLTTFTDTTIAGNFSGGEAPPELTSNGVDVFVFYINDLNVTGNGYHVSSGGGALTLEAQSVTLGAPDSNGRSALTVNGGGGGTGAAWIVSATDVQVVSQGDANVSIITIYQ